MPNAHNTNRACPICGQAVSQTFKPFCSGRCADVDLHRWLSESYRVETEEDVDQEDHLPSCQP